MKKVILFGIIILFSITIFAIDNARYIYEYKSFSIPIIDEIWTQPYCKMVFNATTGSDKENCYPLSVERKYLRWETVNQSTGKIIGVTYDGKEYFGKSNIANDGSVSVWSIPIGQRDFNLFPKCRAYEIEKGVCMTVSGGN